ncbi:PHP domain-containing protein, partial [Actinomadura logoneensis]
MHLHVASAYSARYGAATPKQLADRAAALGLRTLALTDRDGLYGAVRHVRACAEAGIGPVLGADLVLRDPDPRDPDPRALDPRDLDLRAPDVRASDVRASDVRASDLRASDLRASDLQASGLRASALRGRGSRSGVGADVSGKARDRRVVVLAEGKAGWASLCRLVTAAHAAGARGEPAITPGMVAERAAGLVVLLGP